ncbi:bifunctional adenosylcobinamide kinase/adenosylcobinamide-phosphate guanylyltransferase [Paracoccus zhejiangensis]|nr:bifunctional adenosylcobinamide kinase/adenosylcobinamide-phosphate guanylyltransferase [Paracoccus zhejiangensis]
MVKRAMIVLVTGGARSGKSALAEKLTLRNAESAVYIATAEARDDEMSARIAHHVARRGTGWHTVEAPHDLAAALEATDGQGPRLVDCLTLWLANCGSDADIGGLVDVLKRQRDPVVLVTNELGGGIVPDNALARDFRDRHGWMNQAVAEAADQVWMAVCGQPLRLKPARENDDFL